MKDALGGDPAITQVAVFETMLLQQKTPPSAATSPGVQIS